jgi:hypothetical protein
MFDEKLMLQNAFEAWMRHHQMTYSLLERLSDEQFHAEVLKPDLTSFAKHFVVISTVQEAYAQAFTKEELKARLEKADQAIEAGY